MSSEWSHWSRRFGFSKQIRGNRHHSRQLGARRPYNWRYTGFRRSLRITVRYIILTLREPFILRHEDQFQLDIALRNALGTLRSLPKLPEEPGPVVAAPSAAGARAISASSNRSMDTESSPER